MFRTTKCSSSGRLLHGFYGIYFMHPNKQTDRYQDVLEVIFISIRLLIWMQEEIK